VEVAEMTRGLFGEHWRPRCSILLMLGSRKKDSMVLVHLPEEIKDAFALANSGNLEHAARQIYNTLVERC
jgi:hypothetical protein